MSANPPFSILMANFNNGRFIGETVASVLAQTYTEWELIIVDDASTDSSWSVIQEIAACDNRIRVEKSAFNRGVGAIKRRCAQLSRGDLCGILDPDDALEPDAIAKHVHKHAEIPECSLVCSQLRICHETLDAPGEIVTPAAFARPGASFLASEPSCLHFWSFKRHAYNQTEGFAEKYRVAEDQDLWYRLEEIGTFAYVPEPLYRYRQHSGQLSTGARTAQAYAVHVRIMLAALARRRRNGWKKDSLAHERAKVAANIANFLDWGCGKIPTRELLNLLANLLRLQPGAIALKPVRQFVYRCIRREIPSSLRKA